MWVSEREDRRSRETGIERRDPPKQGRQGRGYSIRRNQGRTQGEAGRKLRQSFLAEETPGDRNDVVNHLGPQVAFHQ